MGEALLISHWFYQSAQYRVWLVQCEGQYSLKKSGDGGWNLVASFTAEPENHKTTASDTEQTLSFYHVKLFKDNFWVFFFQQNTFFSPFSILFNQSFSYARWRSWK